MTATVNSNRIIRVLANIENEHATKDVKEPDFTMHYPITLQILIGVSFVVFAVFGILGVIYINEAEGKIVSGSFFGFMCILSLSCEFYYRHWHFKFDDNGITYTPGFGSEKQFRYCEILSIRERFGSLKLKTDNISVHIPDYAIGLNVFMWRLKKENIDIETK